MFGLLDGIKVGVGLLLGVLLMWAAAQVTIAPAAREAGRQEERAVWQKLKDEAVAKAEEGRRAAEAKIRDAEADLIRQDAAHAEQMAALEAVLQEEQTNATPIPTPSPGAACACRPALPRGRVRNELDKLGRTAPPRADPAEPHRAVP